MTKRYKNKSVIVYRLHIAFLIVLFLFILCFYLFPRFKHFHNATIPHGNLTFEIIDIPVTIQHKIKDSQPRQPDVPSEIAELEILDSVFIAIQNKIQQNNGTEIDSQVIAFISDKFPELLEIKEFDPQPIIEASKKVYNFKNYFAYRMNLPDTDSPREPSSPLVDEALGKSKGMLMVNILQIPLSSTEVINIKKQRLSLDDLINVKEHFHLLEYFYEKPALSVLELYNIQNVNVSYTYGNLSTAVETLSEKGFLRVNKKQNSKTYSVAFTKKEILENINRLLAEIPERNQHNREYLYELVHMLITWS